MTNDSRFLTADYGNYPPMCRKMCEALVHCLAYHVGEMCILRLSDPFDTIKHIENAQIVKRIEEKYRL